MKWKEKRNADHAVRECERFILWSIDYQTWHTHFWEIHEVRKGLWAFFFLVLIGWAGKLWSRGKSLDHRRPATPHLLLMQPSNLASLHLCPGGIFILFYFNVVLKCIYYFSTKALVSDWKETLEVWWNYSLDVVWARVSVDFLQLTQTLY